MPKARLVLGLSIFVLVACGTPRSAPPGETAAPASATAAARNPDLEPGRHVWTTPDGVEIPYEVTGDGDVTVMLVHCWMCDRTFWSNQVPVLAERYRTVALDLPGHGEAGTARTEWTVAGYGADVGRFIAHLDLEGVVLVGHSMGGPVSLRAAALAAGRVRGIVAVDTLHDAETEFKGEEVEGFVRAFESDFAGTCNQFVTRMFPEAGVEAVVERVRERSCDPERAAVGTALMRSFAAISMVTWFQEARVPIRAINAAAAPTTAIESNRKYADFDAVVMEGVGHYPHLSRPDEFNPLLLAAIAEILEGPA